MLSIEITSRVNAGTPFTIKRTFEETHNFLKQPFLTNRRQAKPTYRRYSRANLENQETYTPRVEIQLITPGLKLKKNIRDIEEVEANYYELQS